MDKKKKSGPDLSGSGCQLTPLQYEVMKKDGTERPFDNEYWDNKEPGIYVDRITGEPLFCSQDKYDSKTGWPSFFRPISSEAVSTKKDFKLLFPRTEVRSPSSGSHLGHLFTDGPEPTGLRYCMNSAALRFVPLGRLAEEGYSRFLALFGKSESPAAALSTAVFAGGCFWCMEGPFHEMKGVVDVVSGYIGGSKETAIYQQVCTGKTGHREAIKVTYLPGEISYSELLEAFWPNIDPTDGGGQFADRGPQYKSAIYYSNPEEKTLAEQSAKALFESGRFGGQAIATDILPMQAFYEAEYEHQDYFKKEAAAYKRYKVGSGRQGFIDSKWPKTSP